MFCPNCGKNIQDGSKFCNSCGSPIQAAGQDVPPAYPQPAYQQGVQPRVGFSPKISDPAFARYVKHSNLWAGIFATVLAVGVIIGFTVYGEKSTEMGNPQAFFIGLGIGGMFLLIAAFQILKRKGGKTWDGQVVDKTIEHKRRRKEYGENHYHWESYVVYTVHIAGNDGKRHNISVENSDKWYNYYNVGDRIRYHGKLGTYEKYDKTYDNIIFCNACSTENDISSDICRRCKCPLLK